MKKDKLYLFTLLAISIIVFSIGYFGMSYMLKASANQFLSNQIESSKREAQEFAILVSSQLKNKIDREIVIRNVQNSIKGTDVETSFIGMFDWSGVGICHPDSQKIGVANNSNESFVKSIDHEINSEDIYDLLKNKSDSQDVTNNDKISEIIYLYPVQNSDWIIAAFVNVEKLEKQIEQIKFNFMLAYLLSSAAIVLFSLLIVRFLGSYYEKTFELKNEKLAKEVLNLSKINSDLSEYRVKINKKIESENSEELVEEEHSVKIKNRLLTYSKDKLISIKVEEISSINTELSLTYINCLDNKKYHSNSSLDELYSSLDPLLFFRANRQNIISVNGINEILKYGKSQLKIEILPKSSKPIIISKNKVAEFKKWLNN